MGILCLLLLNNTELLTAIQPARKQASIFLKVAGGLWGGEYLLLQELTIFQLALNSHLLLVSFPVVECARSFPLKSNHMGSA